MPGEHFRESTDRFYGAQVTKQERASEHEAAVKAGPVCCCRNNHKPWQDSNGDWYVSTDAGCQIHYKLVEFVTKGGVEI
jgi:hypothetical protein